MREILFRGKRIDNGEWVEGYYYKAKYYRSDNELTDFITIPHPETKHKGSDHIIVIPETVGQYTGLTDKNGKKIFEGDIIRVDDTENAVVEYDETSAFYMVVFDRAESDFGSLIEQYPNVEIIGNIHDNPELLKEREGK